MKTMIDSIMDRLVATLGENMKKEIVERVESVDVHLVELFWALDEVGCLTMKVRELIFEMQNELSTLHVLVREDA